MHLLPAAISAAAASAQQAPCLRIGWSFGHKHSIGDPVEANFRTVLASLYHCVEIVTVPPTRLIEAIPAEVGRHVAWGLSRANRFPWRDAGTAKAMS
jgi:hypothetical protein